MSAALSWQQGAARTLSGRAAWWRYLLLAAVAMTLSPLLATGVDGQTAVTAGLGFAGAALSLRCYRTGRAVPAAWLWIGAGLALNASGSVCEAIETQVFASSSQPHLSDLLYLSQYPCVTVGLLLMVRARHPNVSLAKLIDAATITVGLGLLCWVFLIHPRAAEASGSTLARVVSVAYPVGDLMLLAILAGVLASEGWRAPTVRLLTLGLLAFLLGDCGWAVVNQNGWNVSTLQEALLGEPFLLAFALFGAAALHAPGEELEPPAVEPGERAGRSLLAFLGLAALIPPAILAGQAVNGEVADGVVIAIGSSLMTLLVIGRMSLLLRNVRQQAGRLRELALEDPLTGLPNRRALQGHLAGELARARRDGRALSLAVIDLDSFKRFNDEHGHPAGDQLLKFGAAAWSRQLRAGDMLARVGGEEFVLVLAGADLDHAEGIVGKLRANTPLGQTFSAGVAEWDWIALPEELMQLADAAMYEAKRAGGDRTGRAARGDARGGRRAPAAVTARAH